VNTRVMLTEMTYAYTELYWTCN